MTNSPTLGAANDDNQDDLAFLNLEDDDDDSDVELRHALLMSQQEQAFAGVDADASDVELQRALRESREEYEQEQARNAEPQPDADMLSAKSSPDLDLPDVSQIVAASQHSRPATRSTTRSLGGAESPATAVRLSKIMSADDTKSDEEKVSVSDEEKVSVSDEEKISVLDREASTLDAPDNDEEQSPAGTPSPRKPKKERTERKASKDDLSRTPAIATTPHVKVKVEPLNTPDARASLAVTTPMRGSSRLSQSAAATPSGSKSRKRPATSPAPQDNSDPKRSTRTRRRVEQDDIAADNERSAATMESASSSKSRTATASVQSDSSTTLTLSQSRTAEPISAIKPPLSSPASSQPVSSKPSAPRPTPKPRALTQSASIAKQSAEVKPNLSTTASASSVFPRTSLASTSRLLSETKNNRGPGLSQRPRRGSASKAPRFTMHEDFWLLDGSVVIQIEFTIFKLHRSRLAEQSGYFKHLFDHSKPHPVVMDDKDDDAGANNAEDSEPEIQEMSMQMYGDYPMYVLTNVTVDDFVELLTADKEGIAYASNPPPFPILAAIVRAAHALQFIKILDFWTHHLQKLWPSDLQQLTPDSLPHAAETIILAHHCDFPQVCKRAYYELLRMPSFGQADSLGISDDDEDESDDDDMYADEYEEAGRRLSHTDLVRLITAREKLRGEWLRVICAPPVPSVVPCPLEQISPDMLDSARTPELERCRATREQSSELWMRHVLNGPTLLERGMYDPLCALQKLCELDWSDMGYCPGCIGARREVWEEKREYLWRKLDIWLGLPQAEA